METLTHEILLAFWKIHILHHAAEGSVYGQWVVAELRRHGYEISPGTLYPLLQRMERYGWLKCLKKAREGPRARKNYQLTSKGQKALETIRERLGELYREVIIETQKRDRQRHGSAQHKAKRL